jgi:hypothetical protein
MVSCGALVVNCVAGWGAKFVAKKVPNFFELFFFCGDDEGGSRLITPTVQ